MRFQVEAAIDLRACLTSGQVFRFRHEDGCWVGIDGEQSHCLKQLSPEVIEVAVEGGGRAAFDRLFRQDWAYDAKLAELVARGSELAPLVARAAGLRLLRPSCPRETLFSFLCTSNNHISRISQMVGKLAAYGKAFPGGAGCRFPTLERIAAIPESELRAKGFGYRAATIPKVAAILLERGGDAWFRDPGAPSQLEDLPGVGPKLAGCIALYAFDRTDAVPVDTHLWQAAARTYFPQWVGTSLTDAKRREVVALIQGRFGELAGLAQQILFYGNLAANRFGNRAV